MEIPRGRGWGGGVTKANIFEEKYEVKLEFPEGWGTGVQTQNTFGGGVWVFSVVGHCNISEDVQHAFSVLLH